MKKNLVEISKTEIENCQAQPQLQLQPWLKAEIALFSIPQASHPTEKSVSRQSNLTQLLGFT